MAEPIKVGDLVVVVHDGHEHSSTLGKFFTVSAMNDGVVRCHCGWGYLGPIASFHERKKGSSLPVAWLKKVDPLPESESEQRDEQITLGNLRKALA